MWQAPGEYLVLHDCGTSLWVNSALTQEEKLSVCGKERARILEEARRRVEKVIP